MTQQRDDGETTPPDTERASTHDETAYLEAEVNILRPSTPFMRDHLKLIWAGFLAWVAIIFGPVTVTYLAQDPMTSTTVLGFPLHYFLVAVGGPGGALVLSILYSWRRDKLDEKYGIDHAGATTAESDRPDSEAAATDGGGVASEVRDDDTTESGGDDR